MSEQLAVEGNQLGEQYKFGSLMITFKVRYRRADFLHALYLSTIVPCLSLLLFTAIGFAWFFNLQANIVYVSASALLLLYVSTIYLHWARHYRPMLPFYKKDLRAHIYQLGMICIQEDRIDVVRWTEITRVRYRHPAPQHMAAFGSTLKLWRNDGKKLTFDSNMPEIDTFGRLVEREYGRHQHGHTTATINKQA